MKYKLGNGYEIESLKDLEELSIEIEESDGFISEEFDDILFHYLFRNISHNNKIFTLLNISNLNKTHVLENIWELMYLNIGDTYVQDGQKTSFEIVCKDMPLFKDCHEVRELYDSTDYD